MSDFISIVKALTAIDLIIVLSIVVVPTCLLIAAITTAASTFLGHRKNEKSDPTKTDGWNRDLYFDPAEYEFGQPSAVTDCMLSNGTVVRGATVDRSIVASGSIIDSDAIVEDCILFEGVEVGKGCRLRNCIIDKHVRIPDGETVGINPTRDAARFTISDNGIVVVPRGYKFTGTSSRRVPVPIPQFASSASIGRSKVSQ